MEGKNAHAITHMYTSISGNQRFLHKEDLNYNLEILLSVFTEHCLWLRVGDYLGCY
jgi:hypothetical protein